ncbi:MAG: phosphoribosylamine--glycine ligase [Planctomycetota bacterium]|nr:phosphoribosylamine--glycine ligase [Planctomycetota bacterium]
MPGPDLAQASRTASSSAHVPPDRVNVLLVGGGGREHALAMKLAASPRLGTLWTTHPENPGIAAVAQPVDVPVHIREIYRLQQFCDRNRVGLVVIGPEEPLAEGFADKLALDGVLPSGEPAPLGQGRRLVFGPTAEAARLESDKAWAKQLMRSASIPTAEARTFTDPENAKNFLRTRDTPHVIKASGLAKGKGVVVPDTVAQALAAIDEIMIKRVFGEAGRTVVIEERLSGPELSVLAITDGQSLLVLPPCQDHKRLLDNDEGPNTGGMGAFCPSPLATPALMEQVEREILVPTIDALKREEIDFVGVLYAGLMLTPGGPKVLEFNTRFGDPECQPITQMLKTDLLEILLAACERRLGDLDVELQSGAACCVVLASGGYPEKPRTGNVIRGLPEANAVSGVTVFHAGTAAQGRDVVNTGGRVLGVTAIGADLLEARARAYEAAGKISFDGMQLRRDIGADLADHSDPAKAKRPKKLRGPRAVVWNPELEDDAGHRGGRGYSTRR